MHGAWSDLTLRYNYSFLAVTCSFLLTLFRGAMGIRRQNANIWKEKPSHWHHTVANIEKTQLGKWIFLQLWIWAKVKSWIHASSCFSGWFKPHGPCESGVNQGAYLRCYVLQGFRISSVWCSRGWHTFGVFFLLWKVLSSDFFEFLPFFEDWHGLKKAIWGQWSKEPNSTLFVNTRY